MEGGLKRCGRMKGCSKDSPLSPSSSPSVPPSLLQDKGVFATFKGSFNAESISSFLVGLTTGKEVTAPLPEGKLAVVTAVAWDGKEAVVEEEEEFSLEDIMGEEVRREGGREGGRDGGLHIHAHISLCLLPIFLSYAHTALMLRNRRSSRRTRSE